MAINTLEDYNKVLSVSWITQEKKSEELTQEALPDPMAWAKADSGIGFRVSYRSRKCTLCVALISGTWSTSSTFFRLPMTISNIPASLTTRSEG